MGVSFDIRCAKCGKINMLEPREGIRKVLEGDFIACRRCRTEFNKISVPNSPVVAEIVKEYLFISDRVNIYPYTGNDPIALGTYQTIE